MITEQEILIARGALAIALECGAQKARVTLSKDRMNLISTLDGKLDKCTCCLDRSVRIAIFVDGRYGGFSTNKLEEAALREFIGRAVQTVRMLAPDPCRDLPSQERVQKGAVSGTELDLVDRTFDSITPEQRRDIALKACISGTKGHELLISEEAEYSDSIYDTLIIDSQGTWCRQTETSFEYFVETTIQDDKGDRYSSYRWDEAPRLADLKWQECGQMAYDKAIARINPARCRNRKCNMVVDSEVASKFVSPILRALKGTAVQQHDSFLDGKLGQQVFPEGLTIIDEPHRKGKSNSCLFDDEGVATAEHTIIDKGTVSEYFLSTWSAAKLGMQPTHQEAARPRVLPWPKAGATRQDLLKLCGSGILVTEFNGGNSNSATGDFSFGIEGFEFKNGKILRPVREMLVTGNLVTLWSNVMACADDARECMSKLIPTLAFSNVDFSG